MLQADVVYKINKEKLVKYLEQIEADATEEEREEMRLIDKRIKQYMEDNHEQNI